jgi:hypothetical protein
MKKYRPKNTRWIMDPTTRALNLKRVSSFGPDKFDSYQDYFFFVHIDPIQRFWHSMGMIVGLFFFYMLFYSWDLWSILYYFLGVFFFYGVGVLSHAYYDGHSGKSEIRYFHVTTPTVIKINLLTLTGLYQNYLKKFIQKYPFTVDAFDMEGK